MTPQPSFDQLLGYALTEAARHQQHQAGDTLEAYPPCYQCGGAVAGCDLTTAGQAVLTHTITLVPCGHQLAIDEETVARLADDMPRPVLDLATIGGAA